MAPAARLSGLLLLGSLTLLPLGCSALDKPAWLATQQANEAEANFYAEVTWEGRLYVIGKSATLAEFNRTHELPYRQTFIGAGPDGQTVVIEAEAKEIALQARLKREFEKRHDLEL